jgi:hypothetical protein
MVYQRPLLLQHIDSWRCVGCVVNADGDKPTVVVLCSSGFDFRQQLKAWVIFLA